MNVIERYEQAKDTLSKLHPRPSSVWKAYGRPPLCEPVAALYRRALEAHSAEIWSTMVALATADLELVKREAAGVAQEILEGIELPAAPAAELDHSRRPPASSPETVDEEPPEASSAGNFSQPTRAEPSRKPAPPEPSEPPRPASRAPYHRPVPSAAATAARNKQHKSHKGKG